MDPNAFFKQIAAFMLWLLIWPITLALLFVAFQYLIAPLRRRERAGLLLDLIETALKEPGRPESTLAAVSDSGDPSLNWRFHALAAELGRGSRLAEAVQKVPGFVPAPVSAMLRAGELVGDVGKALPACRQMLKDGLSQTRGAINYLMVLAFVGTPAALVVLTIMQVKVFPQFKEVMAGMEIGRPAGIAFVTEHRGFIFLLQLLLMFMVWLVAVLYIGGQRMPYWLGGGFSSFCDRLLYALPWRRKRMQRDFSAMLAILLDAGVPEAEALTLAADCTANDIFRQRAGRARDALRQGVKLTDAVQMMDDSGEFRWRLTHALRAGGGFFKAIAGWNEALDAKAFQQEQATAHVVTTSLVVLNGILVGFIVVSVFGVLISIINAGVLW
jgi:type II secretory pathway component PulF